MIYLLDFITPNNRTFTQVNDVLRLCVHIWNGITAQICKYTYKVVMIRNWMGLFVKSRCTKLCELGKNIKFCKRIFKNNSLFPTRPRQAMVSPVCHIRSQYPVLGLRGRTLTLMVLVYNPAKYPSKIYSSTYRLNISFHFTVWKLWKKNTDLGHFSAYAPWLQWLLL